MLWHELMSSCYVYSWEWSVRYRIYITIIQGGPEKTKPKLFMVIYPHTGPFSLSHLSICVSFLERFN